MGRYTVAVNGEQAAYRDPAPDALAFFERGGSVDVTSLGWDGIEVLTMRPAMALDDPTIEESCSELAFRVDRDLSEVDRKALANLLWQRYGSRLDNPRGCFRRIDVSLWPE